MYTAPKAELIKLAMAVSTSTDGAEETWDEYCTAGA